MKMIKRDKLGRFVKGHKEGFQKGHKPFLGTEKTRFKKGQLPWNKDKKNWMSEEGKKSMIEKKTGMISTRKGINYEEEYGKDKAKEIKRKMSESKKGKKLSKEHIKKLMGRIPWNKNIPMLKNVREKVSRNRKGKCSGKENPMYGRTGEKSPLFGIKRSEKTINKVKQARAKQVLPFKDSSQEVKIQNFLKLLGIEFFTHQYMKQIEHSYQCDILIPVQEGVIQKTIIECDGEFIHCNPIKYHLNFVRYPSAKKIITAQEIWEKDRIRTKELIEKGFRVLRFWENEVNGMSIKGFENRLRSLR